jgi:hypothetical protein
MRHGSLFLLILTACFGMSNFSCKKTNSPDEAITVTGLTVNSGEISGWTNSKSGIYYSVDSWASPTGGQRDGESYHYTVDPGLTLAAVLDEMMSGPSGASVTIYVVDYSSAANAAVMFNYSKTNGSFLSNPESLSPTYPDSVAVGENSHDGIYVCAQFKQFYCELRFSGYSDFSLSKTDALSFLLWFETKINGN